MLRYFSGSKRLSWYQRWSWSYRRYGSQGNCIIINTIPKNWTHLLTIIQGIEGPIGVTGEKGIQGDQGIRGDKGQHGDLGIFGDKGQKGIEVSSIWLYQTS